MMKVDDNDLHSLRDIINSGFTELSNKEGIQIHPNMDIRVLDVCERLYEEDREGRKIYIDLNVDSGIELDWFVKEFSDQSEESSLLTLSVDGRNLRVDQLWSIYKNWIHIRLDAVSAVAS